MQQQELSKLLRAIEISRQPEPDTESDTDADEQKKNEVLGEESADEDELFDQLTEDQQDEWQVLTAADRTTGWKVHCRSTGRHVFTPGMQQVGCLLPTTVTTPLDIFHQLITPDIIDYFCERTNANAQVRKQKKRARRSDDNKENIDPDATDSDVDENEVRWDDVTTTELRAFIGCVICMGIVQLKDTKQYWCDDIGPAIIRRSFARNRFLSLLANFHISERPPDDQPSTDRLHKVRELAERVGRRFTTAFYPSQWLSIDEAMVGFKGRSVMKQYIPAKTSPTGFKIWMLVDCETNYVVKFEIYPGKQMDGPETGQAYDVVMRLVTVLNVDSWHALGMDGFFSSVKLFKDLYAKGTLAVATTRTWVTGFPQAPLLINKKLTSGQFIARQQPLTRDEALTSVSWMDRKPVNLLTTTSTHSTCPPALATAKHVILT